MQQNAEIRLIAVISLIDSLVLISPVILNWTAKRYFHIENGALQKLSPVLHARLHIERARVIEVFSKAAFSSAAVLLILLIGLTIISPAGKLKYLQCLLSAQRLILPWALGDIIYGLYDFSKRRYTISSSLLYLRTEFVE
jgi:hypothetical protein